MVIMKSIIKSVAYAFGLYEGIGKTLWCNLHLQNNKRFFVLIKDNLHIRSEAKAADRFYHWSHYHHGLKLDIISFTLSERKTLTNNGQIYPIFGFGRFKHTKSSLIQRACTSRITVKRLSTFTLSDETPPLSWHTMFFAYQSSTVCKLCRF